MKTLFGELQQRWVGARQGLLCVTPAQGAAHARQSQGMVEQVKPQTSASRSCLGARVCRADILISQGHTSLSRGSEEIAPRGGRSASACWEFF